MRKRISSGSPWESAVGYSRAVRVGGQIWVAGTTAANASGEPLHAGDAGAQARVVLERIAAALGEAGASVRDVVRTRVYVVDIERDWEAIGRAHGEVFGDIRPAATMVEVRGLIHPGLLVEIEAEAVVGQSPMSTM